MNVFQIVILCIMIFNAIVKIYRHGKTNIESEISFNNKPTGQRMAIHFIGWLINLIMLYRAGAFDTIF